MEPGDYEKARAANIASNKALLLDLGLANTRSSRTSRAKAPPPRKRQKVAAPAEGVRASARLASRPAANLRESVSVREVSQKAGGSRRTVAKTRSSGGATTKQNDDELAAQITPLGSSPARSRADSDAIVRGWTDWTASAAPPGRDQEATFHFADFPVFQPNKSPAEILREGAFGGSYFRPLFSKKLGITIRDDWRELPPSWVAGLDPEKYLVRGDYDASVNKAGVACGQSIEAWEAAGWIEHAYDVRGWFQWYCRFFQGRRCPDDQRQVARWARCVGAKGRWKRTLLKQYLRLGIRHVMDEGSEEEDARDVSPVITQTCLHWAYEVRQGDLDDVWANGL